MSIATAFLFGLISATPVFANGPTTFYASQRMAENAALSAAYNDGQTCSVSRSSGSELDYRWYVFLSCGSGSVTYQVRMMQEYNDDDGGPNDSIYFSVASVYKN